jgi:hypothetical protein
MLQEITPKIQLLEVLLAGENGSIFQLMSQKPSWEFVVKILAQWVALFF